MNNFTIWLTGLSGSGKSTMAERFKKKYPNVVLLDGDILRKGICSDLGFSIEDRKENMRRLRELCKLFNSNGKKVITAFISPFEDERMKAKKEIEGCCIVYCKSSLEVCEYRDIKGLYKKARTGEIKDFTGIGSPFEVPENPDLILDTENQNVQDSFDQLEPFILYKNSGVDQWQI